MDSHLSPDDNGSIRISDSPRRSPQITNGLTSPARSVHPVQMESLHSQADFGHRTTDFFDDSSDDDAADLVDDVGVAPDVQLLRTQGSATRKRRSGPTSEPFASQSESETRTLQPGVEGYQRLTPTAGMTEHIDFVDTPSSSFNGSVDELLPGQHSSPPPFSRPEHVPSGRTPKSTTQIDRSDVHQPSMTPAKVDQILGAHAIAHEITLQALMRDEDMLDESLRSFAPLQAGNRTSLLPPSVRMHDPRSPRDRTFSSPAASSKKVHVLPPPIDTSRPRRSLPADLVRTPYPFEPPRVHRKEFGRSPSTEPTAIPTLSSESILTLSIRRSNPHSRPRVTTLTVPASNDFSAVRSSSNGEKERHFKALDFDDEELFRQLRMSYRELTGPLLLLSARSLKRIKVSGPASKAADAGYGWLQQPRSPRVLAYKGLSDTFSEDKILQHYRKPALGRSRYAFVHWAHRLASAPPLATPQPQSGEDIQDTVNRDLVRRMEQPEGLEFVVSWSATRIMLGLLAVVLLSIAATLLWIFLGRSSALTTPGLPPSAGYRGAGDRVTSGVLMGMCVLMIGLSGIASWLGVSWLAM